jgi:hypothetical protein
MFLYISNIIQLPITSCIRCLLTTNYLNILSLILWLLYSFYLLLFTKHHLQVFFHSICFGWHLLRQISIHLILVTALVDWVLLAIEHRIPNLLTELNSRWIGATNLPTICYFAFVQYQCLFIHLLICCLSSLHWHWSICILNLSLFC